MNGFFVSILLIAASAARLISRMKPDLAVGQWSHKD